MAASSGRRVWLEINLNTLRKNFKKIQKAAEPCSVIGVVKADAYGLGAKKIATVLNQEGAVGFGVANLNEALQIIDLGKPVQVLGSLIGSEIPEAVKAGLIIPLHSYENAKLVSDEAVKQKKTVECHFMIDTGMGRDGVFYKDAADVISRSAALPNLDLAGIYSHFPIASRQGDEFTENQVKIFCNLVKTLKDNGISFRKIHIANSDGINYFDFTHKAPLNIVRTGINIYGSFDPEGQRSLGLESVVSLKSRVVLIRDLPAGMTIGYNCTHTLLKKTRVGTISLGYADGCPLALSNRGYVLINGIFCPIIGRVSMDYITVSLENVPETKVGDEAVCIGGSGTSSIGIENWAQIKGTHAYEILCSFSPRVERVYIG